ncbi:hypothetical protein KY284_026366 [Solanum tuberosum]|nr:hypothetical protein KY284_026366 [Solanum tuberosum]
MASAVGNPIHFDQATIKKTRPSCGRVKVLVDLKGNFPNSVQMKIENPKTGKIRSNMIKIQYDYVPKYYFECKMQGHNKDNCKAGKMPMRKEKQAKQSKIEDAHITEVGNKFDALTKEDDTNKGEEINKDNMDHIDANKGESTKKWVTKSFGPVVQGEKQKKGMHATESGDHISNKVSGKVQEEPVETLAIRNEDNQENDIINKSPINISSHEKDGNSKEQRELMKMPSTNSESSCANSNNPVNQPENQLQVSEIRIEKKTNNKSENQQAYERKNEKINREIDECNDGAIVDYSTIVSADSTQIEIPQSPNEVLHEILIHKESEVEQMQINNNESEVIDDHIYSEADLSPKSTKVIKSERKGRKHGSGDSNQHIRIQPKRQIHQKA